MSPDEQLDDVLKDVRQLHLADTPPAVLGARLRAATASRRRQRRWTWLAATAAAAIALASFGLQFNSRNRESPSNAGFVSLPGSEGLPEPAQKVIIRVQVAKENLKKYGLVSPSAAAEITVDFVVGEDGLPRAVRFVL